MVLSRMKALWLVNWKEEGEWRHYREVKKRLEKLDLLQPFLIGSSAGLFYKLSVYLCEFYLPLLVLAKGKRYDVVVSWSMRIGIIYGILRRLFRRRSPPQQIIYDFHINLTRKDWTYNLRLKILCLALPGIDFFLCTSVREAHIYAKMFGIPPDRICFYPMSPPRKLLESYPFSNSDYIFSYGNSDRDYDTLVEAVSDLETKLVILSQTYLPHEPLPPNVTLITQGHYGMDLIELVVPARIVVLPIKSILISAAQTALLEVMALGRPVIVSMNMATLEYAKHLDSALYYESGDVDGLRKCLRLLLDHPEYAESMGKRAHEAAGRLPDLQLATFLKVLESIQYGP